MKKVLISAVAACLMAVGAQAQDLTISGGNNVSVMICADGAVYAWGMNYWEVNSNKAGNGNLGTENTTDDYVTVPTKVKMPAAALPIKQVDAGSGSHFIAMGCNGTVWCWGNNANGQAGNPSAGSPVLTPVQVKAGEVPSSSGFLEGVSYISGGNDENYAILATGELVAWGQNDVGQLGCGREGGNVTTPVYVCTPDGKHLKNVIMVEAGDETGYALVDEDGDGIGTVYSWGGGGASQLGRVPTTAEPRYYAAPCYKNGAAPNETPVKGDLLDDIVSLTAGDCMAIMIDKDSYVWSFGHGAWGGMTGTWAWGCDHVYANQVLGGETGEPYLKAKAVSAGQGFGMAVTLDGKAVAWGNNGAENRSGGNLGNGGAESSPDPVYIRKTATSLMENCASISDGDTWGFITTTNNEIWTWGDNSVGQLGVGDKNRSAYAKKMNRICSVPDPRPVISFPEDFYTCVPFSYELNSNFVNTNNHYKYEWFKDGVALTSQGTSKTKITVTEVGTYSLKLSYIGDNSPCGMDPVESKITISAYEPDFTVPTGLTFCPPNMKPHVNGDGVYNYYTAQTGGYLLGTSYRNEETTLDPSAVTEKSNGQYTIYVEEAGNATGITFSQTTAFDGGVSGKGNEGYIKIQVYKDIVLDSLSFMASSYSFGNGVEVTGSIGIYGGANVPEGLLYAGESFTTETLTATTLVTVPVKVSLKGSSGGEVYWLAFNELSQCCLVPTGTGSYPVSDNLDGKTLQIVGRYLYNPATTPSPFRNLYFHTSQHFCDRIPMTLTEDCPCEKPNAVTITADKKDLCPGESATLTTNSQSASLFSYVWYEPDGTVGSPVNAASTSMTVDYDNPGEYKVVIYDKTQQFETTSCKKEATVTITANPYPSAIIKGGGDYCEGEAVDNISVTFTGTAPFTFTYNENGTESASNSATTTTEQIVPSSTLAAGDASSEYVYTMASLKDANCTAPASELTVAKSGSATVTIGAVPEATITATPENASVCAPGSVVLEGASNVTGATLAWGGLASGSAASVTATQSGEYTLTATNKVSARLTCTSEQVSKIVDIQDKPVLTLEVVGDDAVCSGEKISLKATSTTQGGTFTWSGSGVTGNGANATVTKTATWPNVESVEVTVNYESEAGCVADPVKTTVHFNPVPQSPDESNKSSYCMNPSAANVTLSATAATGCQLQWYEGNGTTKLNAAPSISIKSANTFNYKVTQLFEGCESDPTDITIVVNDKLKPKINIATNELCIGKTTEVTVEDANKYTVKWSGDGATAGFGSTASSKTPTFTAPSVNAKTEYTIHVYVENAECDGENDAIITVHPTPTVSLSVDDADICDGETATITATISGDDNAGTLTAFTWKTATETDKTTATLIGSNTTNADKQERITYSYTSSHGCKAIDAITDVTVRATPAAPTTEAYTKCLDAEAESLNNYVTKLTGATLNWYGTDATGGTASTTAPMGATNAVVYPAVNYYVSQTLNGCEGARAALPVTINANLSPQITTTETSGVANNDGVVCFGTPIVLSTGGSYKETWTAEGTGSQYLNANTKTFLGTAPAGVYTVNLNVEDANGCKGDANVTLTVNPIPTTSLSVDDADHCISVEDAQTITATPSEEGIGTWGGTVITNSTNTTTQFVPKANTAGDHVITYDFTSAAGCVAKQATQKMTVFPLPTPQVDVKFKKLCHDGPSNISVQTVTTKNTVQSGTFVYSVNNSGTIDAATGEFDPTANAAGDYTITLTYTDPNGCTQTATDDFTVYNKPTVKINAPSEVCYNAAATMLTATVNPTGGSGPWTGTASQASGSFDPQHYPTGENTVSYMYTDPNGCTNSDEKTINVVKVNAPTTSGTSTVMINNDQVDEANSNKTMTAAVAVEDAGLGDVLQWFYGERGSEGIQVGNNGDESYTKEVTGSTAEGSYPYTVRAFRMVDGKECYSDSAIARVVVTRCSAKAPSASDIYICTNDENPDLTLHASRNSSVDSYISWFNADPIVSPDPEDVRITKDEDNHVEFTPTVANLVDDIVFYVAEYDVNGHCWSAGTKVTIHVVDPPSVTLPEIINFCAHGDDIVPIEVSPRTGTLAFKNGATDMGTLNGFNWIPGDYENSELQGTFVYTVESQKYADNTVCASRPEFTLTAHYMAPTDGSTTNWLIKLAGKDDQGNDLIPPLPSYTESEYQPTAEQPVTWYSDKNMTTKIGDDNATKTYAVGDLSATVAGLDRYDVSYWVTRTKVVSNDLSCESVPAEVKLILAECPWAAPTVGPITICSEEDLPNLVATPGDLEMATGQQVTGWKWVNVTAGTEVENTNNSYETELPYTVLETAVTTYKVSYKAEEKNSGAECWSPETEVTVTVNALPKIEIEQIGTVYDGNELGVLCFNGGTFMATAKVNGVVTAGGTWSTISGADIISESGIINPEQSVDAQANPVDATYTVKYAYTDNNHCYNEDTKSFWVEYPESPVTEKYTGIAKEDAVEVAVEARNIDNTDLQTETVVNWYRTTNSNKVMNEGSSWTIESSVLDPTVPTDDEVTYYVSQTVNGCTSERTPQIVELVACPWVVELVTNDETCEGNAVEGMTATSMKTYENYTVNPEKWSWSTTDALDEIAGLTGTDVTYKHTGLSSVGSTNYAVRYYAKYEKASYAYGDVDQYCWSAPKTVTTTVYKNPTVSFAERQGAVCFTDGTVKINVTVNLGDDGDGNTNPLALYRWNTTGSDTSFTTNTESFAYFNTLAQNKETATYDISLYVEDEKGCNNYNTEQSEKRTLEVVYLEKPVTKGYYAIAGQEHDVEVNVTSTVDEGAVIHWFADAATLSESEKKNTISGDNGASWKTGDSRDRIVEKTYYARQFNGEAGCYSEPTPADVTIVKCPIPMVEIEDKAACIYDEIPTLVASTGDWDERDGTKSTFRFYASPDAQEYIESADGSYTPTSITAAGVYAYYVSEYNSDPYAGLTYTNEGCEGSKRKVNVTIIETPAPTVTPQNASVCEGEANPRFSAISGTSDVLWYEENPGENGVPAIDEVGSDLMFIPNGSEASNEAYNVWAVRYANNCYSTRTKVDYMIKRIPEAPVSQRVEVCEGVDGTLTAEAEEGATVNWFADVKQNNYLAQGLSYSPKVSEVAEYPYYVAQRVEGCWGPSTEVIYEVKEIPNAPIVQNPGNKCDYDVPPTLVADETKYQNVRWYSSSDATAENLLENGSSYTLKEDDMSAGMKRIYVTQTERDCESNPALIAFTVNPKPVSPIVIGASVCEGDTVIPTLATNMSLDVWYADEDAQIQLAKGYTYTPSADEVGNKDKLFFVVREQKGCFSDTIPDTLHVIAKPTFSIGNDTTFCVYDQLLTVQAQSYKPDITEGSYINWKVSNGVVSKAFTDNEEHNIYPASIANAAGDYTVTASYRYKYDNIYCNSDEITMNFSIKERARKPIVFSKIICQGSEIKDLQALGSQHVVWKSLDGTLPEDYHGPKYKFQPGQILDTGTYRFEIYDLNIYSLDEEDETNSLGCMSVVDTVSLVVAPGAHTELFGRDSVCMGSVGEAYYTQYSDRSQYFWTVTGDNLNYSKDAMATSVRYIDWLSAGVDTIMVYEQTWAGCEGFDTLVVQIAPAPEAHFTWTMPGSSNIIELKDSTIQDSLWTTDKEGLPLALPIEYTMDWNFGRQGTPESYVDTTIPYNQRNFPLLVGGYLYGYNCPILTVTNDFGCTSTYTECIFVNLSSSLYVPTAFSPSNPAHAVRTFQPKGFNLASCEISVYDKWGNLMWFSNEVKDGMFVGYWDGRYEGKMAKADVYIWKMEATFLDGQVWQGFDSGNGKMVKFGSVMLLR